MSKNISNPTLQAMLATYGCSFNKVASKRKTAEEAQDGVDSELANEDGGKSVDTEAIFNEYKNVDGGLAGYSGEGGNRIADGMVADATTPSGEESTFENYMLGESGGTETKKTVEDPGYQGASVTPELSTSGSTVEKGAAFLSRLQKFAATQQSFITKIAVMQKLAEGLAADPTMMAPADAMAGMAGPGMPAGEAAEMSEGGGDPGMGGELDPETAALIEAIIQEQSEDPLAPEELAQIEAILGAGDEAGGGGGDPGMEAAMAGGGDPMAAGGDGAMEEPGLSPDEGKIATALRDFDLSKLAEDDDDGGGEEKKEEKSESSSEGGESKSESKSEGGGGGESSSESHSEPDGDEGGFSMGAPGAGAAPAPAADPMVGAAGGGGGADILSLLSSLSPEQLQALVALCGGGAGGAAPAPAADPMADMAGGGGEGLMAEPSATPDEMSGMMALAQAEDENEYKEAAYYGMSIPEYRAAKDSATKQAALQAKNAEQANKAKRYGQSIDSLIRK